MAAKCVGGREGGDGGGVSERDDISKNMQLLLLLQ